MAGQSGYPKNLKTGLFESSSSTRFKKTKFQHKWSIHDFTDYCDLKETKITSAIFSDGTVGGLKWRLEMNAFGSRSDCYARNSNYLSVDLYLVSNNVDQLDANCQISILNGKLEPTNNVKRKVQFTMADVVQETFSISVSKYDLLNPENLYLVEDKLTILCEIVILGSNQNTSSQFALPDDLGLLLYENPDYTVITFSVSGKKLYALKTILVANSPVFAAMFNHEFKENKINLIEIEDVEYEVMEKLLRYLYTNKISNIESMVERLLFVADKYQLEHLKHRCEVTMSEKLTFVNAAQYYVLADRHNAEELISQVQMFIMANAQAVKRTLGFNMLYSQHALLFNDVGLRR